MMEKMKNLMVEEEGQGLVEYALIIGLVSVALIGTLGLLVGNDTSGIKGIFKNILDAL